MPATYGCQEFIPHLFPEGAYGISVVLRNTALPFCPERTAIISERCPKATLSYTKLPLDTRQEPMAFSCRMPRGEMKQSTDLLQGTLDLLILKSLALASMHGWGIAERIQQVSKDALQIGQGSLYPALHRLEYKGWIKADWGVSENNRRAKFYSLTRAGKKQLQAEMEDWNRLTNAIALVLERV